MAQITTGIRSVLSSPRVYDTFQDLMGAKKVRQELVSKYIRPQNGLRILDIGCGTARILDYLPDVVYHGFDLSQTYIDQAVLRYGARGNFSCSLLEKADIDSLEPFDVVLATGLIHHLSDEQAHKFLELAWSALKPGGRLITNDPCYTEKQNFISKYLVSRDRGQNVRNFDDYPNLAKSVFANTVANVRHWAFIPYTRCSMECTK